MDGQKGSTGDIITGRALRTAKVISPLQTTSLRFQLTVPSSPADVKAGLQRLCALYEAGYVFKNPAEFRQLIHGLTPVLGMTVVRRWSYKALALVGTRDDIPPIARSLKDETDAENQTWAIFAIRKLSRNKSISDICQETGIDLTTPVLLAGHLFEPATQGSGLPQSFVLDIATAAPLSLMWGCLLEGYGRAPDRLFERNHDNLETLKVLHTHPEDAVSEYSIWSLWNNPKYGARDLGFSLDQISKLSAGARRWTNRLITRPEYTSDEHIELVRDLTGDPDDKAREGLAIGLRNSFNVNIPEIMVDWLGREFNESIKKNIYEHMAKHAEHASIYGELTLDEYSKSSDETFRSRLLSAAEGKRLYAEMKVHDIRSEIHDLSRSMTNNLDLPLLGVQNMTTYNFNGPVTGQNQVFGAVRDTAFNAVQNLPDTAEHKPFLIDVLSAVDADTHLSLEDKSGIQHAVHDLTSNPTPEAKKTLVSRLTSAAATVGQIAGSLSPLLKLAASAQELLS